MPGQNLVQNAGFETAGASATEALNWQPFGIGFQRNSAPHHAGLWALQLQTTAANQLAGAYQRIDLNQTSVQPVFIGGFVRGQNIVNSPSGYFGASLYAEIHLQDGSVAYWNSILNTGTFAWRWIGFNTGSLATVNQPISHIFVVPILGNATGTAYFDDITVKQSPSVQAAVTIMFDDGEVSTFTEGKPVLDQHGLVGSSAVVTGSLDIDPDFMTWDQVGQLHAAGWGISSHGVTHTDLTTISLAAATQELALSKATLQSHGMTPTSFAFPFGAYNSALLAQAAQHYAAARPYEIGDNPQGVFPYQIQVRSVVNSTTPAEVASWIQQANAKKQWVVLVFHKIAPQGDDAYYTVPATFQAIIQAVADSGVAVVNFDHGAQQFGATR